VRYLIFCILLLLFSFSSEADFTPFDFSLGRYLIDESKEMDTSFKYDLENYEEEDLLVRPLIENGIIEIFNIDKNSWVGSYAPLSELPSLKKSILIRIKGFVVQKSSLKFEIFNTKSGEIYTTPPKNIWSKRVHEKYLVKLNDNLSVILSEKKEVDTESESLEFAKFEKQSNWFVIESIEKIQPFYILLIGIFCFFTFFYIGFKRKLSKKKSIL